MSTDWKVGSTLLNFSFSLHENSQVAECTNVNKHHTIKILFVKDLKTIKYHTVTRNLSLCLITTYWFEQIVLVISKFLQILGLQPRISKVFLDH